MELFQKLDSLHTKTDVCSAFILNSIILELLSMFLDNSRIGLIHTKVESDKVNKFINANISNRLSVKMLAQKMNFNEKYFISVFKKHFNTTPAHYIKTLKLEKVKCELLCSNTSIMDICNNIGYSSVQQLSKDFKAYTGLLPSEFKRYFKDLY